MVFCNYSNRLQYLQETMSNASTGFDQIYPGSAYLLSILSRITIYRRQDPGPDKNAEVDDLLSICVFWLWPSSKLGAH